MHDAPAPSPSSSPSNRPPLRRNTMLTMAPSTSTSMSASLKGPTSTTTTTTTTNNSTPTTTTPSHSRRVPLDKRKRTETSCDKCKSRKQKCRKEPGHDTCRYCLQHNIPCQTTQPRKKRLYGSVESLGNRLALLESLVQGLLPDADVANLDDLRQLGASLGIAVPESPRSDDHPPSTPAQEHDEPLSLLPDQQGQVQFIGPASSFSFHLKLRHLCGQAPLPGFSLFGNNAADSADKHADHAADQHQHQHQHQHHHQHPSPPLVFTPTAYDHTQPAPFSRQPADDQPVLDQLVAAYFDHINPDFPVLYEHSFREAYRAWLDKPAAADLAWQCCFLCVLLLARRVAHVAVPPEQETLWWKRVQTLLPVVIFTSSVTAVQAIMLAAMHLHNTSHRDACWNLTGTAIRIAFSIGLHQDKASTSQPPLARELRKRLWWTLYAFEQMQVSSYDRPSAIEHHVSKNSCPNERILGPAAYAPLDYARWYDRLIVHLSSACRAPKHIKPNASDGSYASPLSPAAGVLRDLDRWKSDLPQHLRLDALDTTAPAFQRPILLLHALLHYTTIVLCRSAILARATTLSKEQTDSTNIALVNMSDTCAESSRALANILLKLDALGRFDAVTWWDVWYSLAAASTLVLDLVCQNKLGHLETSESRLLLPQLADLIRKHLQNPNVPGTIAKFGSLVPELHAMAESVLASHSQQVSQVSQVVSPQISHTTDIRSSISDPVPPSQTLPSQPQQQVPTTPSPFAYSHPNNNNNGAYVFADATIPSRFYSHADYATGAGAGGPHYSHTRGYDRSTQMQFMDFTVNNIHDWNWGDMGNLLGSNDGGHPMQHHHQVPAQQILATSRNMSPGMPPGSAPGPYS